MSDSKLQPLDGCSPERGLPAATAVVGEYKCRVSFSDTALVARRLWESPMFLTSIVFVPLLLDWLLPEAVYEYVAWMFYAALIFVPFLGMKEESLEDVAGLPEPSADATVYECTVQVVINGSSAVKTTGVAGIDGDRLIFRGERMDFSLQPRVVRSFSYDAAGLPLVVLEAGERDVRLVFTGMSFVRGESSRHFADILKDLAASEAASCEPSLYPPLHSLWPHPINLDALGRWLVFAGLLLALLASLWLRAWESAAVSLAALTVFAALKVYKWRAKWLAKRSYSERKVELTFLPATDTL